MTRPARALAERWALVLRERFHGEGERALQRAYDLGREALTEGLGVLDLAAAHQEALESVLGTAGRPADDKRTRRAAKEVLAEGLAPFEMTHRGHLESVATLRRINETLEAEARRIAHALHDESAQILVQVHLALDEVAREMPPDSRHRLDAVRAPLLAVETQLRRVAHELRPTMLDDLGLVPALEYLAKGVAARGGFGVGVDGDTGGRLPQRVETALYRVVQEALSNVLRHAKATHVRVQLVRGNGRIECTVRDDGSGIRPGSKRHDTGLGLRVMRERIRGIGGSLEIQSAQGRGTEIRVTVPLEGP